MNNKQINSWQANMRLFAKNLLQQNEWKMPEKKISRQFHVWSLILQTKNKRTRSHKIAAPSWICDFYKMFTIHRIPCTLSNIYLFLFYLYISTALDQPAEMAAKFWLIFSFSLCLDMEKCIWWSFFSVLWSLFIYNKTVVCYY